MLTIIYLLWVAINTLCEYYSRDLLQVADLLSPQFKLIESFVPHGLMLSCSLHGWSGYMCQFSAWQSIVRQELVTNNIGRWRRVAPYQWAFVLVTWVYRVTKRKVRDDNKNWNTGCFSSSSESDLEGTDTVKLTHLCTFISWFKHIICLLLWHLHISYLLISVLTNEYIVVQALSLLQQSCMYLAVSNSTNEAAITLEYLDESVVSDSKRYTSTTES